MNATNNFTARQRDLQGCRPCPSHSPRRAEVSSITDESLQKSLCMLIFSTSSPHSKPFRVHAWPVKKAFPRFLQLLSLVQSKQFSTPWPFWVQRFLSVPFFQIPSTHFTLKNERTPGQRPWERDIPGATLVSSYHRKWHPSLYHRLVFPVASTVLLSLLSLIVLSSPQCPSTESRCFWSNGLTQSHAYCQPQPGRRDGALKGSQKRCSKSTYRDTSLRSPPNPHILNLSGFVPGQLRKLLWSKLLFNQQLLIFIS